MAFSFYNKSNEVLSFDEFINNLNKKIKSSKDIEGLLKCHDDLYKLSNNDIFFIDFINNELKSNFDRFQADNRYSSQSFILFRNKKFYIRVNWWPMINESNKHYETISEEFAYNNVHDHNFPFLTVGYKGAYSTKLWEYNHDEVTGYIGEKVNMTFLEETQLEKGKVMYYRPSKDIHKQLMPKKELSISINIILDIPLINRQYVFDDNNFTIKSYAYHPMKQYFNIFKFLEEFSNDKTKNILESLTKSSNPHLRFESYKTIAKITEDITYWHCALTDKEKFISNYAKLKIN